MIGERSYVSAIVDIITNFRNSLSIKQVTAFNL